MERLETARAELDRASESEQRLSAELEAVRAALEAATSALDEEAERVRAERADAAAGLDEALLRLYEKVRESSGGTGAAVLRGRRCEGCHLELPPQDLQRIRTAPPDEVVRCEECRRILVRTADSAV
jgi:predicted  nucleic acid-binding Zn-ribbon protein